MAKPVQDCASLGSGIVQQGNLGLARRGQMKGFFAFFGRQRNRGVIRGQNIDFGDAYR